MTRKAIRQFFSSGFAAIGALGVIAGLADVLFATELSTFGLWLAWLVVAVGVAFGLFQAWPRAVSVTFKSPLTRISIVRGDLFEQDAHLVIGMSDTFDTAADVIAPTSVQAQFLAKFYGGDGARFDADLETALSAQTVLAEIPKAGKQQKYQMGTVATLGGSSRRFFCVAYTQMNERHEARATVDGVWSSLTSLWDAVCSFANGGVVAIPVIGGGQSRLSQALSPTDAIRLQALSFWLRSRQERLCEELRIVVRPHEYDRLDTREIQSFLDGFKQS